MEPITNTIYSGLSSTKQTSEKMFVTRYKSNALSFYFFDEEERRIYRKDADIPFELGLYNADRFMDATKGVYIDDEEVIFCGLSPHKIFKCFVTLTVHKAAETHQYDEFIQL